MDLNETDSVLSTGGTLTNHDVDNAETFVAQVDAAGTNGVFNITTAGVWTYTANSAFDSLNVGDSVTDSFTVAAADGTTTTVRVTIHGTNDAAILSSAVVDLNETDSVLSTGGTLTNHDVDNAETFVAQVDAAGTNGVFNITTAGVWTYTANSAFDSLNVGDSVTDSFTVAAADGTTTTVRVTIHGTNDAPIVSGPITSNTNEDASGYTIALLQNASDVDHGTMLHIASLSETTGHDHNGVTVSGDSLVVNPSAYNYLAVNESVQLNYTYNVIDGDGGVTPTSASITIEGRNDAPVVSSAITFTTNEDAATYTLNLLANASDVDTHSTLHVAAVTETSGNNASGVTLIANGLQINSNAYNSLAAGESVQLHYTYNVVDDHDAVTSTEATITIEGRNDAPVGEDSIVTAVEDVTYLFKASDFLYTDNDHGSALASVRIDTLPTAGTLKLNDIAITEGQTIAVSDLNLSNLTYVPVLNANGNIHFTFSVNDGIDYDSTPNDMTIHIAAVNDAPQLILPTEEFVTSENNSFDIGYSLNANEGSNGQGIFVNDVDAAYMTVTLSVQYGALTVNASAFAVTVGTISNPSGTLSGTVTDQSVTLSGTVTEINGLLSTNSTITYNPGTGYYGTDTLHVTANDGGGTGSGVPVTDTANVTIHIVPVSTEYHLYADTNRLTDTDGNTLDNHEIYNFGLGNGIDGFDYDTLLINGVSAAAITVDKTAGSATLSDGSSTFNVTLKDYNSAFDGQKIQFDDGSILKSNTGAKALLVGTSHDDQLLAGNLGDTLRGLAGNDKLVDGAGNDYLYGGSGADKILGGHGGTNHIYGDQGNDVIDTTAGTDVKDYFVYSARSGSAIDGDDTIDGFRYGVDKIQFSDVATPINNTHMMYDNDGADGTIITLVDGSIHLLGVDLTHISDGHGGYLNESVVTHNVFVGYLG